VLDLCCGVGFSTPRGGTGVDTLGLNEWNHFVSDFKLAKKSSKYCKKSDVDRLFVMINAADAHASKREKEAAAAQLKRTSSTGVKEDRHGFTRAEFMAALVHLSIYRYVMPEEISDVSEALAKVIKVLIVPKADPCVFADANEFRRVYCYNEATTRVLEGQQVALRRLFTAVAESNLGSGEGRKLVGLGEWRNFMRALEMVGDDLSERDVTFAFIFSRMCVVDNRTEKGAAREAGLPFEGFLEALVRIAPMKALPTDEEIAEAGQADAGMYLQWLGQTDEAAYENLLEERATPWGAESADQPIDRCVAHVISIIIRTIEADSSGSDDCNLTQHEINDWLQYALKSKGKG